MSHRSAGYLIDLNLRGRPVVVVGLGAVGRRKAAGLLAAGARVLGIDPAAAGIALPPGIEVRAEPYDARHLDDHILVIAAATPEVNERVVHDAHRAGLWVCSASNPDAGDFTVPAVWNDGPVTLAVSTQGASPALAASLRDRAAAALGPAAGGLSNLLAELRPQVLARIADPSTRKKLLTDWAQPRWLELWKTEGNDAVRLAFEQALEAKARESK